MRPKCKSGTRKAQRFTGRQSQQPTGSVTAIARSSRTKPGSIFYRAFQQPKTKAQKRFFPHTLFLSFTGEFQEPFSLRKKLLSQALQNTPPWACTLASPGLLPARNTANERPKAARAVRGSTCLSVKPLSWGLSRGSRHVVKRERKPACLGVSISCPEMKESPMLRPRRKV